MNELERNAAEIQLAVLKLQHKLLESKLKGDVPGHPFRGNQFSGGGGGSGGADKKLIAAADFRSSRADQLSEKADRLNTWDAHIGAAIAHDDAHKIQKKVGNISKSEYHLGRSAYHRGKANELNKIRDISDVATEITIANLGNGSR